MKYIIRCTCGGVKTKMEAAMQLIAPGEPLPLEVKGGDAMRRLAEKWSNTNFGNHLLVLAKKHGRYCYYVEVTDNGDIKDMRDLMTGRRMY